MQTRGQAATEYVIIIAIILAALIPIFYYTFSESNRTTRVNQAADAVNTLARKAESVYAIGPGTRDYVWISVPTGIDNTLVDNGTIRMSFSNLGDAVAFTRINITGTIPVAAGTYRMAVEMLEDVVIIGPVNDTEAPEIINTQPDGIVSISNPTLSATTNEPATCRYDTSDKSYSSMTSQMGGSGIGHSSQLNGLNENDYTYFIRCIDRFGNAMSSSAKVEFTVILDNLAPFVNNTQVDSQSVYVNNNICVNATVTDTGTISEVWVMMTTPLESPLPSVVNYTMSDTASCAGVLADNIYGVEIKMQAPGIWYINTTSANDTAGNLGIQNPEANIIVNVSQAGGTPGNAYNYKIPDSAWHFKTPDNAGITAKDNQSSLTLYTLDLADEDKNTPPSVAKFYYTSNKDHYEGFIIQINQNKNNFKEYSLRLKTSDAQELPYNLTIYSYSSDGQSIITTNTTNLSMTNIIINGQNRGFNEANITQTILAGTSQFIKIRIAPQTTMNGDTAHITEADIGVIA